MVFFPIPESLGWACAVTPLTKVPPRCITVALHHWFLLRTLQCQLVVLAVEDCGRNKLCTLFNDELFKIEMKQILKALTLVYCTMHRSLNQLTCLMDIYSTLRFVYLFFFSFSCVLSRFCLVFGFSRVVFNNPFNLFLRYSLADIRISIC